MNYRESVSRTHVITVTHTDVGATLHTVIRIGDVAVASYMPGTRHEDTADEIARNIIQKTFLPVFYSALVEENVTIIPGEEYPDDDDYASPLFQ